MNNVVNIPYCRPHANTLGNDVCCLMILIHSVYCLYSESVGGIKLFQFVKPLSQLYFSL